MALHERLELEVARLRSEREAKLQDQEDEAMLNMMLEKMVGMNASLQNLQARQNALCAAVEATSLRQTAAAATAARRPPSAAKAKKTRGGEGEAADTRGTSPGDPSDSAAATATAAAAAVPPPLPASLANSSVASILSDGTTIAEADKKYLAHVIPFESVPRPRTASGGGDFISASVPLQRAFYTP
eukprot:Rhum_TRINITY_DN14599_c2_g1::Rhum_TRINITY_DN14599_c2_g1_i1::g.102049::m.102049